MSLAGTKIGTREPGLRSVLVLGALLFLATSFVTSQPTADSTKEKTQAKSAEAKSEPAKIEPAKGPPQQPGPMVKLTWEKYQELLEQIQKLKKRPDRQVPHSCKLIGELKDNVVVLEAEIGFMTKIPNMIVPLGLQGGYLIDQKGLDQQKLAEKDLTLKVDDDGFILLEAAKPGIYQVPLHLKVPVAVRQSGEKGSGDRGFTLGLPGAAVTSLSLAMPDSIKEIRWNKMHLEKTRDQGRWLLTLGAAKVLDIAWKEPVFLPGSGPLLVIDNTVSVKLEETSSLIAADMLLEDKRGQTREWHLFLPPRSEIKAVEVPAGLTFELLSPPLESKNQPHIIRLNEPTAERFSVKVEARSPRKDTNNLVVGPFFVQNANLQQGTITVLAAPAAVRGQYLSFVTNEGTYRRDVPKGPAGQDVKAIFKYWNVAGQPKGKGALDPKIPLRIDWRADKGSVETSVDHQLKMKLRNKGVLIDLSTQIKVKSLSVGEGYLDVQLPRPVPWWFLSMFPTSAPFPANMSWGVVAQTLLSDEIPLAWPTDAFSYTLEDDPSASREVVPDSQGKARITFPPANKEFNLTLTGRYLVPSESPTEDQATGKPQHFRIDLPRPLGIVDRGGKVWAASADGKIELLMGPPKVDFKTDWDSSFTHLDLAWRPYHPQFLVQNVADVTLLKGGKEAYLSQQLTFNWSPAPGKEMPRTGLVALRVPENSRKLKVVSGGKLTQRDPGKAWVNLVDNEPLVVEFYQPLPESPDDKDWKVPLIAPEAATGLEAKVRIWCDPGMHPQVLQQKDWQDRGLEEVPGRPLPALVLHSSGRTLDLTLKLPAAHGGRLPVMVCDKGLIQVSIDEEKGDHRYRARYLIQKLYADTLTVEFPAPADSCIQKVTVNDVVILHRRDKDDRNVAHFEIDPKILKSMAKNKGQGDELELYIEYNLPAKFAVENDSRWQTKLTGPVFRGDVFLGRVRWVVGLPPNWVPVVAASNVHPDFRWSLQSWLLAPEPLVSSADLEQWPAAWNDPSLVFSRRSQESLLVIHMPRQTWLMLCSGLLLAVGLALHLVQLSRSIFWIILLTLAVALIVGGFLWPAWVPALLFGIQPGALVLVLILGIHWVLKERYRRQVIFMPGFTRLKPGSSLLSNSPASRPREPSTVDAPAPSGVQGRGSPSGATQNPAGSQ